MFLVSGDCLAALTFAKHLFHLPPGRDGGGFWAGRPPRGLNQMLEVQVRRAVLLQGLEHPHQAPQTKRCVFPVGQPPPDTVSAVLSGGSLVITASYTSFPRSHFKVTQKETSCHGHSPSAQAPGIETRFLRMESIFWSWSLDF